MASRVYLHVSRITHSNANAFDREAEEAEVSRLFAGSFAPVAA